MEDQGQSGQSSERSLQSQGSVQSQLVKQLLAGAESLPQFVENLLRTQAVFVAATEAAAFLVEKLPDGQEPGLKNIAHIRADNSTAETRAAALAAFQQIVKPC